MLLGFFLFFFDFLSASLTACFKSDSEDFVTQKLMISEKISAIHVAFYVTNLLKNSDLVAYFAQFFAEISF